MVKGVGQRGEAKSSTASGTGETSTSLQHQRDRVPADRVEHREVHAVSIRNAVEVLRSSVLFNHRHHHHR